MDHDRLNRIANDATQQLMHIWDRVGCSEAEKSTSLQNLCAQIEQRYDAFRASEYAVQRALEDECARHRDDIGCVKRALGRVTLPHEAAQNDVAAGKPLREQVKHWSRVLCEWREAMTLQRSQVATAVATLTTLWTEMGTTPERIVTEEGVAAAAALTASTAEAAAESPSETVVDDDAAATTTTRETSTTIKEVAEEAAATPAPVDDTAVVDAGDVEVDVSDSVDDAPTTEATDTDADVDADTPADKTVEPATTEAVPAAVDDDGNVDADIAAAVTAATANVVADDNDVDVSDQRLALLRARIDIETTEQQRRVAEVTTLLRDMREYVDELCLEQHELEPEDRQCLSGDVTAVGTHTHTLTALHSRKVALIALRDERQRSLKTLAQRITHLWHRLSVTSEERQCFLNQHSGLGVATLSACERELERLQALKAASLQTLIHTCRASMAQLWTQTHMTARQRREDFPAAHDTDVDTAYTDAALTAHEAELARLQRRLATMTPLLKLAQRRDDIVRQQAAYAATATDPNRFKIPGRLLAEEKFRRVVSKTLPKLVRQLQHEVPAWEAEFGPFRVTSGVVEGGDGGEGGGVAEHEATSSSSSEEAVEEPPRYLDQMTASAAAAAAGSSTTVSGDTTTTTSKATKPKTKKSGKKTQRPATADAGGKTTTTATKRPMTAAAAKKSNKTKSGKSATTASAGGKKMSATGRRKVLAQVN